MLRRASDASSNIDRTGHFMRGQVCVLDLNSWPQYPHGDCTRAPRWAPRSHLQQKQKVGDCSSASRPPSCPRLAAHVRSHKRQENEMERPRAEAQCSVCIDVWSPPHVDIAHVFEVCTGAESSSHIDCSQDRPHAGWMREVLHLSSVSPDAASGR